VILTTLYLTGAKLTDSWCARMGDLQRATLLDVSMVPSSSIAIIADGECLACGGFSFGEPILLGNFEFIVDYFSGLSPSPEGAMKVLFSWAQLTAGHLPRSGP
jgi:hypothetical protein